MNLPRRRFLLLAAGAGASLAVSRTASAQAYPSRPVRIVVGFAAGGGTDLAARFMAQWLSARLGQPFIVENRPGAGGNVATEVVVRASPDGYTLLVGGVSNAIAATLYEKLNFNFIHDIAPVAGIISVPNVVVVTPSFPAETLAELIEYARKNPGHVNFASAGNGTSQHVSGELLKMMAGVSMVHVPYRGAAQALTDVLAGQVPVLFASLPGLIDFISSGKLRSLGVTTSWRSEALPRVPTVSETVPGYEASGWFGIGAPKGTPTEVIELLNREINAGLALPEMRKRLAELGGVPMPMAPATFGRLIVEDTDKWAKVVKFSGAKPD
jgi:tripartite-type tricarboxylate transporter receptor subunit TctC